MIFGADARRQPQCVPAWRKNARISIWQRGFRDTASSLLAKADEFEELPSERLRKSKWRIAA